MYIYAPIGAYIHQLYIYQRYMHLYVHIYTNYIFIKYIYKSKCSDI